MVSNNVNVGNIIRVEMNMDFRELTFFCNDARIGGMSVPGTGKIFPVVNAYDRYVARLFGRPLFCMPRMSG